MDEQLNNALESAISTMDLEDANVAASLACDHWSTDIRVSGSDLKDSLVVFRHSRGTAQQEALMEIENLLTDLQGLLEEVAR